jgi:RNA polymerase sigma-70 factor (ECF subfamily)
VTPVEAGERFAIIFREQQPALLAYLVGRTGDPAQAADLTQEVMLRAWRHLPELLTRTLQGQRAWLFTVARNLVIDDSRRARTRGEAVASAGVIAVGSRRSAGDEAEAAADLDRISTAIAYLPEDLRVCLALATVGALSSQEISALLDVPAGTVRYRLSRARATLRRALDDRDPPNDNDRERLPT